MKPTLGMKVCKPPNFDFTFYFFCAHEIRHTTGFVCSIPNNEMATGFSHDT